MPYVTRDQDGHIVAVHATQSAEATEALAPGSPELRAFLGGAGDSAAIEDALSRNWNRERIADYARQFSISSLADRVFDCYSNSIGHSLMDDGPSTDR